MTSSHGWSLSLSADWLFRQGSLLVLPIIAGLCKLATVFDGWMIVRRQSVTDAVCYGYCVSRWCDDRYHVVVPWAMNTWRLIIVYRWRSACLCLSHLPFDALCCHMGTAIKHPVPDRVKASFAIFDIRALWRSGLGVRVPGYQRVKHVILSIAWRTSMSLLYAVDRFAI